jgi:outer membrane receptor for ferrienterochelin and colicin
MAPRAWFKPLSVFPLLLATGPARPQDGQVAGPADESILFQEIPSVYGASKHEQKTSEAPSSVTIITAADIQHYGYTGNVIQDQIEQDGTAFLLKATCRF